MGSVRIIRYKFVNGTHIASKVSHFHSIANCIKEMHQTGFMHGDVRGFNMLHPHPQHVAGQPSAGIKKSLLIDFDLSCKSKKIGLRTAGFIVAVPMHIVLSRDFLSAVCTIATQCIRVGP
jgi:tRNA A-37 threonylcarbamoyl transferase component Bud32